MNSIMVYEIIIHDNNLYSSVLTLNISWLVFQKEKPVLVLFRQIGKELLIVIFVYVLFISDGIVYTL